MAIVIHVDFFPVYSTSTLTTAKQMNLCFNIPHLCAASILNKTTRFKDFHGSNLLTYLYLFVILCGNSYTRTSNQIQVQTPVMALPTSHVGYVMLILDGRSGNLLQYLQYLVPHKLSGHVLNYV